MSLAYMCTKNSTIALPAADIIGGIVGGVIGGLLLITAMTVCVCICIYCIYKQSKLQQRRPISTTIATYPEQPATYRAQATPYQPYIPPPPAGTSAAASQPGSGFVPPQPEPKPISSTIAT